MAMFADRLKHRAPEKPLQIDCLFRSIRECQVHFEVLENLDMFNSDHFVLHMFDLLIEGFDWHNLTVLLCSLPVLHQFYSMLVSPFQYQTMSARRNSSPINTERLYFVKCLRPGILGMKMRWRMIVAVDINHKCRRSDKRMASG